MSAPLVAERILHECSCCRHRGSYIMIHCLDVSCKEDQTVKRAQRE